MGSWEEVTLRRSDVDESFSLRRTYRFVHHERAERVAPHLPHQRRRFGQVGRLNTGTTLRFWPDPTYFDSVRFSVPRLKHVLRGKAVLGAFRGAPARDVDALVKAIRGLSDLYIDHRRHLSDLEVNPLIVGAKGEGVRAVDVRPVWR